MTRIPTTPIHRCPACHLLLMEGSTCIHCARIAHGAPPPEEPKSPSLAARKGQRAFRVSIPARTAAMINYRNFVRERI